MSLSEAQIKQTKSECLVSYSLSSGPGGQNVNKNSTKATIRWHLQTSQLPDALKSRLFRKLKPKLTVKGELVIASQTSRVQSANVKACYKKLISIIDKALHIPKRRIATRPTKGSVVRRLDSKKKDSYRKKDRKKVEY